MTFTVLALILVVVLAALGMTFAALVVAFLALFVLAIGGP